MSLPEFTELLVDLLASKGYDLSGSLAKGELAATLGGCRYWRIQITEVCDDPPPEQED